MPQLTDKKNKIIIYLIFLFILSTTNVKYTENKNNFSPIVNRVKIEGLSNTLNKKISNELNNLFYENIMIIKKEEIKKVVDKYNIIEEYNIKKIYPSSIRINI